MGVDNLSLQETTFVDIASTVMDSIPGSEIPRSTVGILRITL